MSDRFVVNSRVRARRTISAIAAGCETLFTMSQLTAPTDSEPSEPAPPSSRAAALAYTSYLRVVAIVGVVFIHIAGLTYNQHDLEGTPGWWLGAAMKYGSKWAVLAFVMVSGALLLAPPARPDAGTFYRRRLARLGIPLLVWHIVYISLAVLTWSPRPSSERLLAMFLEGQSYTGLYFFWLILGLYAVTPLLWPVAATLSTRALALAGGALAALPVLDVALRGAIALLSDKTPQEPELTMVTQFLPYVGYFLLGYALRNVVLRGARLALLAAGLVVLLVEQVVQATVAYPERPAGGIPDALSPLTYQGLVVGLSAVAVFVIIRSLAHPGSTWAQPARARRARALGDLTFGVFACHLLVFFVLAKVLGLDVQRGAESVAGVLAINAAVVVVAFAVAWLLSRTPVLRRAV